MKSQTKGVAGELFPIIRRIRRSLVARDGSGQMAGAPAAAPSDKGALPGGAGGVPSPAIALNANAPTDAHCGEK